MSDKKDFPRWLYQGNDLTKGRIVQNEVEAEAAGDDGFAEYEPKPEDTTKAAKPAAKTSTTKAAK